ncbi:hypothetical protein TIFTF001_038985 [Ficus carica]|uniref:Uncharacterized protein n=1 Tax=Ficus carica TaxID=3494 RepID=A0AA88E8B1_FICCA|nr:hypothetical protein TIFTF001_038985 [Ficus carica]
MELFPWVAGEDLKTGEVIAQPWKVIGGGLVGPLPEGRRFARSPASLPREGLLSIQYQPQPQPQPQLLFF